VPHAPAKSATLLDALRTLIGDRYVLTDAGRAAYATDIFHHREMPAAVVSPASVGELQAVVRLAVAAGFSVVPRGGGASYTDGYLPTEPNSLLLDLARLDRIVEINEEDAYVTVEAGATWAQLAQVLAGRGLRTAFRGPFSGSVATVGGTMAQHAISHGTGAYGVSGASVLSLDVVLANGDVLRTGSALAGSGPFCRHYGPDFTGLFLGDCGAFGVKARITMGLLPVARHYVAASFGFARFEDMHAGMRSAAREAVDDTHFALDAAMIRGQLRRPLGLAAVLRSALGIARSSRGPIAALRQLIRMALAGRRGMTSSPYLAHYIIEAADAREAAARLRRLRDAMRSRGHEITNTIPTVVRNQPFERMFHVLGPKGERWVPVHGVLPHSRIAGFQAGLRAVLSDAADFMQHNGVWIGSLYECIGAGGFTIELGIYWPDAISAYHRAVVPAGVLAALPVYPANEGLRAWIEQFRARLVDLYRHHGAVFFQLGKVYPYASAIDATGLDFAKSLKCAIDPCGRLNPGALGL
jgi:FAD/FMN-containing dehydrogenase